MNGSCSQLNGNLSSSLGRTINIEGQGRNLPKMGGIFGMCLMAVPETMTSLVESSFLTNAVPSFIGGRHSGRKYGFKGDFFLFH